jgi:prepilin-type N-terminal cleavage/methylation domain-containing protein
MSVPSSNSRQQFHLLKRLLARRNNAVKEQGLTLIECLVAVFVIGLTVTLITPPLFIAAATRAQNRRAEQALQVAQGEIDRIRVMVARDKHTLTSLPKTITTTLQAYPPPSSFVAGGLLKTPSSSCPASVVRYDDRAIDPDKALKVDVDGDCVPDFFMQVFRTVGNVTADETTLNVADPTQERPSDFQLGVRVYSMLADGTSAGNSWANLKRNPVEQASLQMTNGDGSQRTRPLAMIYTPFAWSDQSTTLCDYFQDSNPQALPGSCKPR